MNKHSFSGNTLLHKARSTDQSVRALTFITTVMKVQVWAQGFQWEKGEIGTPGSEWLGAPSAGFQVPWVFFTSQGRREQPTDGWMCAASAAAVCSVFLPSAMTSSCGEDEIVVMSATNEIPLFLRERLRSSVNLSPHLAGCRPSWG